MTLPTLQVLLDNGTGSFPYDITKYVIFDSGYSYNRGRADWQGGVTAGQLSLTLNNSDGRFTPGSTLIASLSPIRVDQRIRVKATINGTTFTRFTGYVKSWPTAWPATVGTIAFSTITATDAQARAERRVLKTMMEEEILQDSPTWHYMLNEPTGATSYVDASGNAATPLVQDGVYGGSSILFGTTPGPAGGTFTAADFMGGPGSGFILKQAPQVPLGPSSARGIAFKVTGAPASVVGILPAIDDSTAAGRLWLVTMTVAGKLDPTGVGAVTANSYNDGAWHYAFLNGGELFVDGVSVLNIGSALQIADVPTASVAQMVGYSQVLTAGRIATISSAVLGTLSTESGTAGVTRLAGYADIPLGSIDSSLTNVPFAEIAGTNAWPAIEEVVAAEMGVAYVDENGSIEFHNRNKVPAKTSPDLTLVAYQYVAPDVQPVDDDQQILNYVETQSSVTGVTQVVRNTLSELGNGTATNPGHGRYSDSKTYLVSTDAEALDRANWIVANFAEPTTRYGTLTINLFAMSPAQAAAVLTALDLDMWLRVIGMATQNTTGTTANVVVQGFTEQADDSSWSVTCNVVLRSLFNAWLLGDSTYGVLDSTTELYI